MKSLRPPVAAIALALLAGCANQGAKPSIAGKWTGSIPVASTDPGAKAGVEAALKDKLKIDLSLKDDQTFDLTMFQRPFGGHWTRTSGEISLHIETLENVPLERVDSAKAAGINTTTLAKPMRFTVDSGETSLKSVPNKEGESIVVLKRDAAKG